MDNKAVKLLLEQTSDTIKSFIELMIGEVKKEVNTLKSENWELKRSLQFSQAEIDDLKSTVNKQKEEIKNIQQCSKKTDELEERI